MTTDLSTLSAEISHTRQRLDRAAYALVEQRAFHAKRFPDDRRGLEQLLDVLQRPLRALVQEAMQRCGVFLQSADVDDLLQDLLTEIWRVDLPRFNPERGTFMTFLRAKVRWRLLQVVRRRVTESEREGGDDVVVQAKEDPHTTLAQQERKETLSQLVDDVATQLTGKAHDRSRHIIARHDLQGVPLRIVAGELGLHPSNVTRTRRQGLRLLARRLPARYAAAA